MPAVKVLIIIINTRATKFMQMECIRGKSNCLLHFNKRVSRDLSNKNM